MTRKEIIGQVLMASGDIAKTDKAITAGFLKSGDIAKRAELVIAGLSKLGDIFKTVELITAGLSKTDISRLHNAGYLERIRHGFYRRAGNTSVSEELLLKSVLPEGIVCVESALFHFGYSDFTPRVWSVAVPRTISRAKLKVDALALKAYYIPKKHYEIGKTVDDFNGVELAVYDRERTICDCFKYRSRLDDETFNKAVHAYVADDKKNPGNLSKYAKELGVFRRVNELMEVLLNA